jgi:opacity protein-like surface antigen
MTSIRVALFAGAAVVLTVGSALADGYSGRGRASTKDFGYADPPASWYVRLDAGYATHDRPTMVEAAIYDLSATSIEDTWTLGAGIGRYFTQSIRGDITYDHRFESDVRATNLDGTVGGTRITPYLGIGLGAVNHRTSRGTAITCGCADTIESGDDWHVAGALMAGFSVGLGRRTETSGSIKDAPVYTESSPFHLDFGYRFLYLGETKTGPLTSGGSFVSGGITVEDIHAHEFRVGLRWDVR